MSHMSKVRFTAKRPMILMSSVRVPFKDIVLLREEVTEGSDFYDSTITVLNPGLL